MLVVSVWANIECNVSNVMCLYQVGLATEDEPRNDTYRLLLAELPGGQIVLEEAYSAMHNIMTQAIEYTDTWKKYKNLWSGNLPHLYGKLGTRLKKWMTTLQGIR